MANPYDKILKEIVEEIFVPMAQRMLGIYPVKTEELPDDLHQTIERKPDFLKKVRMEGWGPDYILHFEFQSTNEPDMIYRMLEYYALLYRKYRLPIVQCVFYLGSAPMRMQQSIEHERLLYSFKLRDFRELSASELIRSQVPEEVILAILGDFGSLPAETVIEQILTQLRSFSGESLLLDQRVRQLEVLSQIRNLQNQITQILSAMPFTYELEKDIRFQQGITKEKGEMIRRMLQSEEFKTGALTVEMIAAYADESPVHIREVQAQLQSEDETSHS